MKAARANYEKARNAVESYTTELNEVSKDADRALKLSKQEAETRFKRIPKDAHKWSAATNKELKEKAKSCSKTEATVSTSVTYESCMAKDEKASKKKKKKKKATPESKECKYVSIIQGGRPDEPSKTKKKIEIPKLEKVKKDYDLKIAFRARNVEYYERRLSSYQQLTEHLSLVRSRLPSKKMAKLATADISEEVPTEVSEAEAKMSKEDRKKAEAKRAFSRSLSVDDRLFVAYRLLNASRSKKNVDTILTRLTEKDESVFQIYLQGASRHAKKGNVAALREIQEEFAKNSKVGDDDKKRKQNKIRSLQLLPIIELAKQRSL